MTSYITLEKGQIAEVRCKVCQTPIKKFVEHDVPTTLAKVKGQTILGQKLLLAELPAYREVAIAFEDGSRHVTSLCATDALRVQADPSMLQAVYDADVAQWESEGIEVSEQARTRVPVSVTKIARQVI